MAPTHTLTVPVSHATLVIRPTARHGARAFVVQFEVGQHATPQQRVRAQVIIRYVQDASPTRRDPCNCACLSRTMAM